MELFYKMIEKHLYPRLNSECRRLGIPPEFIAEIVPHSSPGIKPITLEDGTKKIVLFISEYDSNPWQMLSDFYYTLSLAKAEYEGKDVSNFRATLYEKKRMFQETMNWLFHQLKKIF